MDGAGGVPILRGTRTAFGAIPKLRLVGAPARRSTGARARPRGAGPRSPPRTPTATPVPGTRARCRAAAPRGSSRSASPWSFSAPPGSRSSPRSPIEDDDEAAMLAAATAAADRLGWPVAVKLDAPGLRAQDGHRRRSGSASPSAKALRRAIRRPADGLATASSCSRWHARGVELIVGRAARSAVRTAGPRRARRGVRRGDRRRRPPARPVGVDDALEMLARAARHADPRRRRAAADAVNRRAVADAHRAPWAARWSRTRVARGRPQPGRSPAPADAIAVDALIVADSARPAWDYEDPGGAGPTPRVPPPPDPAAPSTDPIRSHLT